MLPQQLLIYTFPIHMTLMFLAVILKPQMKWVRNWKRIYEKFLWKQTFNGYYILFLSFTFWCFLSLWIFVWRAVSIQQPPCNYLFCGTATFFVVCCGIQLSLVWYINTPHLTGNPPQIFHIFIMHIVLTKQGTMEKQEFNSLK